MMDGKHCSNQESMLVSGDSVVLSMITFLYRRSDCARTSSDRGALEPREDGLMVDVARKVACEGICDTEYSMPGSDTSVMLCSEGSQIGGQRREKFELRRFLIVIHGLCSFCGITFTARGSLTHHNSSVFGLQPKRKRSMRFPRKKPLLTAEDETISMRWIERLSQKLSAPFCHHLAVF
jgi:hypothetical protein